MIAAKVEKGARVEIRRLRGRLGVNFPVLVFVFGTKVAKSVSSAAWLGLLNADVTSEAVSQPFRL